MKILYLAPRYHTNQAAIMKGWLSRGDEVFFLSQYVGKSEDYSCITPEVIGYSKLFMAIDCIYVNVLKRKDPYRGNWKLKAGFPPVFKLKKRLKQIRPDVAIIRERSVYSIVATALCRLYHIPAILYNQSPVWEKEKPLDWKHKLVWKLVPEYRISPVLMTGIDNTGLVKDEKAYWLPFVMEPQMKPSEKQYFVNDQVNIFSVGKFERRKNHLMMLAVIEKLQKEYPIHLTIAGECSSSFHREYLEEIKQYIDEHELDNCVTICENLRRQDVFEHYQSTDIFVLPSTGEPAAVSHLEAMAFAIPALCSTGNGTASYIANGQTGFVFKDKDEDDLELKLRQLLDDRQAIREMGKKAYEHVQAEFQFDHYYQGIAEIMEKIDCRN